MNFFLVLSVIKNQKKVAVVKDLQLLRDRVDKADANVVQNLMSCLKTWEVITSFWHLPLGISFVVLLIFDLFYIAIFSCIYPNTSTCFQNGQGY